ncbi:hypothetical protein GCM10019059_39160 [Camelimonas fluminis]|uniref:Uncharacterized protein n=1 Tax=Camelimonas fluminis TaxID=1576911 RepID=A0ABV7UJ63_9HYPH|nr:hypothetical protein [Camelimonas fluminis]GHE75977.1 hypothetical protein GCM10019059_39160 [Camelimonas fluminis]
MNDKNANFHRLAQKRLESISEAVRIFGNLSSNNYDWSPTDVQSYLDHVGTAIHEMTERFHGTKRWKDANPVIPLPTEDLPEGAEDTRIHTDEPPPASSVALPRSPANADPDGLHDDIAGLEEMVAMQRRVIEDLQMKLNAYRSGPNTRTTSTAA